MISPAAVAVSHNKFGGMPRFFHVACRKPPQAGAGIITIAAKG